MSEVRLKFRNNNILLITDLYPLGDDSSIPLAIENFSLGFKDFGINVEVIRPNFLFNSLIRKHKIYKSGIYQRNGIKIYNRNFFLPFIFDNLNIKNNFDLIISHMPSGNIYADLINKKLNLPRVSILHNSDIKVLEDFKYSIYFKGRLYNALKNSALIGARNSNIAKKINADFILPSFIDKKYILKTKNPKEKLKIITISRLIKRKNIDMIIKALSKLKVDFQYDIYGEGEEKTKLLKLTKKYNLESKINFHGKINHGLIWEKLDNADVFILPSKDETFGLCYLEAMARGLIVIAKKNESMDNIIENNKNGFLIENKDEIKNILENLDINKKQEMVDNVIKNIQNFEKENVMKKYIETIEKICFD